MKYTELNRMLWKKTLVLGCVMAFLLVQGRGIKVHAQGMDGNLVDRLKMHVGFLAHDSLEEGKADLLRSARPLLT